MNKSVFNHCVSIIAYSKDHQIFAGTYAWMMQVGYEEIIGLLGSQSQTGNNIKKGDIIGVNVCSKEQKEIATVIGNTHSKETNKLQNISYKTIGNAILLDNSKANLVCEVIDIIHLKNIEDDNLIYMKIQKMDEDDNKDYLTMADF